MLVYLLYRHKKRTSEESFEEVDENPVYGVDYSADGEHVDYGDSEVQDENQYYGR